MANAMGSCPAAAVTSRSMRMSRAIPRSTPPRPRRQRAPPPGASAGSGGGGRGGNGSPEPKKAAVFDGAYGPWSMEPADYAEVWGYRACLAASALCGAGAAAEMLLLSPSAPQLPPQLPPVPLDALLAGGALPLGAGLILIHVYVTPLKRFVQLLWLLGAGGALAIRLGGEEAVLVHAAAHPWPDVLLLGPLAAAAAGVAVKEGFCFRRPEAAALALALPALCLTHLLSAAWRPASAAVPLLGAAAALAALALALGKAGQPAEGDVGDKSVFEFRKLSGEAQAGALARLRAADDAALRGEAAALARERAAAAAAAAAGGEAGGEAAAAGAEDARAGGRGGGGGGGSAR